MKSINFGAFWKRKDREGNEYLSGTVNIFPFGNVNVTLFANKYKKAENHPDYNAVYTPAEPEKPAFGGNGEIF